MSTPVHTVDSASDPRLTQLHAAYETAKAERDEAAARLDAVTAALKVEMTKRAPQEAERITLTGESPALSLTYTRRRTLDTKRLRATEPDVYQRYTAETGAWVLRLSQGSNRG